MIQPSEPSEIKRTILLSLLEESMVFDSLTHVIDNPTFLDWNNELNIDPQELQLIKLIGHGSSGDIYHGVWKGIQVRTSIAR